MKKLILAAVVALSPVAASAAPLTGAWAFTGAFSSMGINFALNCRFTQTGGALSGPCRDPKQPADVQATGSVAGANVTFAYDTNYMGVAVHLVYKGVLQPNGSIAGGVDAGTVQGTFSGARSR